MGNEQGRFPGEPTPAGIQSMDENLQKKFAKGIQYNSKQLKVQEIQAHYTVELLLKLMILVLFSPVKIVLRGDRNTGKSCLFHRMEGKVFQEAYIPTNEIQVWGPTHSMLICCLHYTAYHLYSPSSNYL